MTPKLDDVRETLDRPDCPKIFTNKEMVDMLNNPLPINMLDPQIVEHMKFVQKTYLEYGCSYFLTKKPPNQSVTELKKIGFHIEEEDVPGRCWPCLRPVEKRWRVQFVKNKNE